MNEELKLCPFCLGTAQLLFERGEFKIECKDCPASMAWFDDPADAALLWNERPK